MNKFEKSGYELYHYYDQIAVVIDGKEYHICDKAFGKTNYDKEIEGAYKEAQEKGIIPINKWK